MSDNLLHELKHFRESKSFEALVNAVIDKWLYEIADTPSDDLGKIIEIKRKIEALKSLGEELSHIINTQSLEERNADRKRIG